MEYVYILTNVYVPDLVKFGFSTRDPQDRATELSAPTGVPGQWAVHHYWEVEDGYAVEQEIFKRLSGYRLERQEFFRLTPDEAVRIITREIRIVGTNPIEKARLEAEVHARERQVAAEQRERERAQLLAKKRELEERKAIILRQVEEAQAPIRAAMEKSDNTAFKVVTVAIFVAAFFANEGKGFFLALLTGVAWIFMCYVFPIIPISIGLMKDDSRFHEQLTHAESRVLAAHGLRSREELEVPIELRRYD